MKVYRFMSFREFNLMEAGCDIVGKSHYKARTNSSGVCFLPEVVEAYDYGYTFKPDKYIEFMSGVATTDVLVEFEADEKMFTEAYGVYAFPYGIWDDDMDVKEYNIPQYNREYVKPTRYAMCGFSRIDWYTFNK